jgi:hypothetical protein
MSQFTAEQLSVPSLPRYHLFIYSREGIVKVFVVRDPLSNQTQEFRHIDCSFGNERNLQL